MQPLACDMTGKPHGLPQEVTGAWQNGYLSLRASKFAEYASAQSQRTARRTPAGKSYSDIEPEAVACPRMMFALLRTDMN